MEVMLSKIRSCAEKAPISQKGKKEVDNQNCKKSMKIH